jgi:ATP-dependent helicase/nuclease subunit A
VTLPLLCAFSTSFSTLPRRRLLHDAPHHIQPVTSSGGLSPRRLGDIVHRALKWWRFPGEDDDLESLLRSYAWEQGIVRSDDADKAVKASRDLLHNAMQSSVYQWLDEAAEVYRELPFVYHTEKRTIYGVIDVLFRRHDGSWGIIDYKTSFIPKGDGEDAFISHASRFCLQLGVYAAAVREYLREMLREEVVPDVFIHYIRYSETVLIPRDAWEDALHRLEDHIGLLGLSHDSATVRTTADVGKA